MLARSFLLIVDPVALQARGLTLTALADALGRNNLNVGGGTIDVAGEASLVQGVALLTRREDVEQVVVTAKDGSCRGACPRVSASWSARRSASGKAPPRANTFNPW